MKLNTIEVIIKKDHLLINKSKSGNNPSTFQLINGTAIQWHTTQP